MRPLRMRSRSSMNDLSVGTHPPFLFTRLDSDQGPTDDELKASGGLEWLFRASACMAIERL